MSLSLSIYPLSLNQFSQVDCVCKINDLGLRIEAYRIENVERKRIDKIAVLAKTPP